MKNCKRHLLALTVVGLFGLNHAFATNPIIMDQFTADPTARVFEGKMYLYPSHDMDQSKGQIGRRGNWFAMADYHVFSSENLTDWTDHGVLIDQTNVPWLTRKANDMWAPECVFKNGKYYFYFPAGGRIGVLTADHPEGPFKPEHAIAGAGGIDPCVLIDTNGDSYLYTATQGVSVSKLKDNMIDLETQPLRITNLPTRGLVEGPFVFERKGIYYLTYPHAATNAERLEYSISTNPMGPFKWMGVFLDEAASGCWTVHHSVVEYHNQWYLFYHDKQLSPNFDKNRSVKIDKLYFNDDGTIQKVIPTLRGVGLVDAKSQIQIDRYSAISDTNGVSASFLDTNNTFAGWKISLNGKKTWVEFDDVDFGKGGLKSVNARSQSATGGTFEIHADKVNGPVLAKVKIEKGSDWAIAKAKASKVPSGVHNLFVTHDEDNDVDIDWVSFQ